MYNSSKLAPCTPKAKPSALTTSIIAAKLSLLAPITTGFNPANAATASLATSASATSNTYAHSTSLSFILFIIAKKLSLLSLYLTYANSGFIISPILS